MGDWEGTEKKTVTFLVHDNITALACSKKGERKERDIPLIGTHDGLRL